MKFFEFPKIVLTRKIIFVVERPNEIHYPHFDEAEILIE